MKLRKPTVVVIKASLWKTAYKTRNHPEYAAILDLVRRYGSEIHFVLVGISRTPTSGVILENGITAWDIQATGTVWKITYYLNLLKLLFRHRPHLVIVLGMTNVLPVALYSVLTRKSRYVPVFIGEFGYYGNKRIGQILNALSLKALGISLRLSRRKILDIFTLSSYTQRGIEKLAPNLRGKIQLLSYPISPKFFSAQEHFDSNYCEEPMVLTVAAIEPRKGLDTLIKAASFVKKKFRVVIKGSIRDDAYLHKLELMVKNLNIEDKVTFVTEIVDYDDIASYYKSATLFVLPTREDCLGVVILEALHCGVPVIATSVGGVLDMIENGVNGILIRADDPLELSNAISLLLENDALRRKLVKNARRVLCCRYYKDRTDLRDALVQSIKSMLLVHGER